MTTSVKLASLVFFSFFSSFFFSLRSLINPGRVYDLEQTMGIENLGSEAEKLLGEVIRIMHKFSICFSVLRSILAKNEKAFIKLFTVNFIFCSYFC